MALAISYRVTEVSESVAALFEDLTGDYPNPATGWGYPNYSKSQVSVAMLTIFKPAASTLMPDENDYVLVDLLARNYPVATSQVTLLPTDFSPSYTSIPDGIYKFRLNITVVVNSIPVPLPYVDYYAYFSEGIICCKTNLVSGVKPCCDECLNKRQKDILRIEADLMAIEGAQECNNMVAGAAAMLHAKGICSKQGCKRCGC